MEQKNVGFWRRFFAYFIDSVFITVIFFIVSYSVGADFNSSLMQLISFAFSGLYLIFFWGLQDGQTLGNRVLKIKIIKEDGSPMDIVSAIVRYIGFLFSCAILLLGLIWVAFDKKKQGWHDKIARTVVVETGKVNVFLVILSMVFGLIIWVGLLSATTYKMINQRKTSNVYTQFKGNYSLLSENVFQFSNDLRQKDGLALLTTESRLCAYAQRRLEQLNTLGKVDDGKGFYEDTSNPQIMSAYFSEYTGLIGSNYVQLDYSSDAEKIVNDWWSAEKSNLKEKTFTNGCVRADKDFLVFIFAAK